MPAWVAMQRLEARRAGSQAALTRASAGPMRTIPYRPLIAGVLVNAALIFLVLLVLRLILFAPLRPMRRLARMQRGWCPSCGYDIRYNFGGGCAECGFLRER